MKSDSELIVAVRVVLGLDPCYAHFGAEIPSESPLSGQTMYLTSQLNSGFVAYFTGSSVRSFTAVR